MATVVAVSTAAAAAAATTAVVNTPVVPEPILSVCGLANPDIRTGRFTMNFEGFPRVLDDRESSLVENLVKQSYNEITLGPDFAVVGCLDPLAREMQGISIVNQTLMDIGPEGLDLLEVLFEATVSCDRCSSSSPLFSEDQLGFQENASNDNNNETATAENVTEATSQIEQRRWLRGISFDSQEFFQKHHVVPTGPHYTRR